MVMYATSKASLNKPELDLDNAQEVGFVNFFKGMPKRLPGTIRIFDRRDYYSAHGEDALYVADHVYHTKTVLKYLGTQKHDKNGEPLGLPSTTMSKAVAIPFLRDCVTIRQMRVEVYEIPSSSSSSSSRWQLSKSGSPGNLSGIEDLLFGGETEILEAPILMSLTFKVSPDGIKNVGICYCDSIERKLGVLEYVDNDIWSNTELGVKECLVPVDEKNTEVEGAKLRKLIDRCQVIITERKRGKNIEQDLNGLLKGGMEVASRPEYDQKLAMGACASLISYLGLLTGDAHRSSYILTTHDLSQYMKLDSSAMKALTLMPDAATSGTVVPTTTGNLITSKAGKDSAASLFGLLNKCKTGQGTRLLAMWLKQPLVNLHEIEIRQQLVQAFFDDMSLRTTLRDNYLKLMPDFQRIAKRFQNGKAILEDVVRTYISVSHIPDIITALETLGREKVPGSREWEVVDEALVTLIEEKYLIQLRSDDETLAKLRELVETTIDVDQLDRHKCIIKPEFDPSLQKISNQMNKVQKSIQAQYPIVSEDLGFGGLEPGGKGKKKNPLNFENQQVYGWCFRLTRKEATAIKNKKGYIELANRTNGCYFTTRRLKELNEENAELTQSYEKQQSHLAKEVVKIAGSYASILEGLNSTIAHLDVINSMAHVANHSQITYVRPKVLEKGTGDLILKDSRHPCLETLPDINFIPNDVEMLRGESEFHIITGANTGGKSVYLRQIGCIALLAQIGSFVPAAEAQIPIFDCILARVGAGDSQLKGISTFMAEMLETATILKSATKDSLIIIDELGRGTSTYDGFGLAWAISEHIATSIRSFALFATHFHDLTTLAEQVPHVKNLHVMAHVEESSDAVTGRDIVMLYKVQPGISDQSFGIHVAELAKFPLEVVRLAKRKASELEEQIAESDAAAAESEAKRSKCSQEEIAEGTGLVAEMVKAWADKLDQELPTLDDAFAQSEKDNEEREKRELQLLKDCLAEFQPRLDSSKWAREVLVQTY